jgi:hypothetical protein
MTLHSIYLLKNGVGIFSKRNDIILKILLESDYDNEYNQFKDLKGRKKLPLIRSIEDEMYSRDIK